MNVVCMTSVLASLSVVLSLEGPFGKITHMCYGGFYTVKHTHTYISCVNFCWFSRRCKAVNWVSKSRECRLHDSALADPSQTTTDPRCISTEVHTSHMDPSHPCSGRPCPDTYVCAPAEAASSHVCLPLEGSVSQTTTAAITDTAVTTTDLDATTTTTAAPASTTLAGSAVMTVTTTFVTTTDTSYEHGSVTQTTTAAITDTAVTTTDMDATTTTTAAPATTTHAASAVMTVTTTSETTTDTSYKHGPVYTGCFLDDRDRMINELREVNDSMTHEWCLTRCRQGNYLLAGLENHDECFCGNSYDNVKYTVMSEGDCNAPCKGNSSQMCGGRYRLSLFQCT
ncbi:WSC domain-containing protein ARB_07870-like [Haliotis rufescens]|uniref:WSC domain-containing protein ARB_07870-like n=1 Tax=Haliotis rufescens TaxID=6454 RepID=UPI00201EC995|nr:WSC domain-containing protein ARB_07870-like [Haliotis rufescens]